MGQQLIYRGSAPNDGSGDPAYIFTNKINQMFAELYGVFNLPIKITGQSGIFTVNISANTWVEKIVIWTQTGTPDITIGTTSGGNDICDTTQISTYLPILVQQYFNNATTLYFTNSGGNINLRIDQINNFQ